MAWICDDRPFRVLGHRAGSSTSVRLLRPLNIQSCQDKQTHGERTASSRSPQSPLFFPRTAPGARHIGSLSRLARWTPASWPSSSPAPRQRCSDKRSSWPLTSTEDPQSSEFKESHAVGHHTRRRGDTVLSHSPSVEWPRSCLVQVRLQPVSPTDSQGGGPCAGPQPQAPGSWGLLASHHCKTAATAN
jgi:hypothetical protein